MVRAVLAVLLGWLLLSVPVGLFTLLALLAGVDCGQECGGDTPTIVPVLAICAALTLILAPVLVGWSVRRPWSPAWKIGVGIALPPLVAFILLATGGIRG